MESLCKVVLVVFGVAALVVGFCALNLRCSRDPGPESPVVRVAAEIEAGKREARNLQADDLARLAQDLRVLAKRYKEQGEDRKAHRAIGAAQELDRKIYRLRNGLKPKEQNQEEDK